MIRRLVPALAAFALGSSLLSSAIAQDAKRTGEVIVKEIDGVEMPKVPANRQDPAAVQAFITARKAAMDKRATLIDELYKADPDNDRLPALLRDSWAMISPVDPRAEAVEKQIDEILANSKNEALKIEAQFRKAVGTISKNRKDLEVALPAVDAFIALAPKDRRAGQLLYTIANGTEDKARKEALENRLLTEFPESPFGRMILGLRKQRDAIGKPFNLPEFKDAIGGDTVSMDTLKGKVVVVDFWATWCGPCVAEMPTMKKLYAEYKPKGVEFVGVSLDQPEEQGGLKSLKEFAAKNEITWPQYYQGNYWNSEFSSSWGINAIPCVFIVDADGNLYSTEARGKLEELIPTLLEKKPEPAAGGGQ